MKYLILTNYFLNFDLEGLIVKSESIYYGCVNSSGDNEHDANTIWKSVSIG